MVAIVRPTRQAIFMGSIMAKEPIYQINLTDIARIFGAALAGETVRIEFTVPSAQAKAKAAGLNPKVLELVLSATLESEVKP